METLLLDGQRREQMITQGMAKVRTEFSAARMAEQFEEAMLLAKKD